MTAPHDRPTVPELLEAVREFVEAGFAESAEARVRFHARVAANVLCIVERELALGAEQQRAHEARLRALGFRDDAALAAAIKSRSVDDRYDEIARAVRDSIHDKLLVANPGYIEI
ncbi:MAG: DUF6285 domain-containing protein [Actinomycetota bacterium]|nr:DUF6285 domain-containing protein [Actinomycetota bacterium]